MFPTQSVAMRWNTLSDIKTYYQLPPEVWAAFLEMAGDPGDDLKLLAALPPEVMAASLSRAKLADGEYLTAVHASHVGLVYRLARRILHVRGGGDWDQWVDPTPWPETSTTPLATTSPTATIPSAVERKLKMTQILDQGDDGDFTVEHEGMKAKWFQQYLQTTGGWPPEEEEPSLEQLSALHKRMNVQDIAPFADFAIFVPYGQRALRASKFRTFVASPNGYVTKELPGPASFHQWRACFRVFRTAMLMLDAMSISTLHNYEAVIERLNRLYPTAWHLVYSADELARSAHSNRTRSKIVLDTKNGIPPPRNWDPLRPWDFIYQSLAGDEQFWQTQVHGPALAWVAAGSKGLPKTPAEQIASSSMQGGVTAIAPVLDTTDKSPRRKSRKEKKEVRKKRAGDKEEESPKKTTRGGEHKEQKEKQKCFAWNNGNGPCGELQPGQACVAKIKREHKCTICNSPGYPSRSCPQKK